MSEGVTLNLNGHVIHCDVARTHAEHTLGLQRYASLAPDEGLLFAFDRPAYRSFTMKEVRFPIDIIFLRDNKVVRVAESIMPGDQDLYSAGCDAVLEVRAGVSRKTSLRVGSPVEVAKQADGFNEWSPQDQQIHERETEHPDEQYRDRETPDTVTQSSPGMYDEAKDKYFESLWGDTLAGEALDVRPELQTRVGQASPILPREQVAQALLDRGGEDALLWLDYVMELRPTAQNLAAILNEAGAEAVLSNEPRSGPRMGAKTAGRSIVVTIPKGKLGEIAREEADVARREQAGETLNYFWQMGRLPKEQPDKIFFAWDGAVRAYHDVTGMDTNAGRLYMATTIHDIARPVEMEPFRGYRYFDWPAAHVPKTAQIVDEQKFVDKTAPILFAHADLIPWKKDALNGGATERAVVSRSDLAQWLSGNQESGQGAAEPGSVQFILQAAGDDSGMKLIGTSFVMAELADYTRLGFSGGKPILVLYRETPSGEETEQAPGPTDAYMSPTGA